MQVAEKAARAAGDLLLKKLGTAKALKFKYKNSMVTEADYESEQLILDILFAEYPSHNILTEEDGITDRGSKYKWIIDPLDGTTNFLHTYPYFCVSIALEVEGVVEYGVVYNPLTDELFSAELGNGAFSNGSPISPSNIENLDESLVITGFTHEFEWMVHQNIEYLKKFIYGTQGFRRDGSAALDLSYVASGRAEAFWEIGLNPWDVAAGALILKEAGGNITDFSGDEYDIYGKELLSSNGLIHSEMVDVIKANTREW